MPRNKLLYVVISMVMIAGGTLGIYSLSRFHMTGLAQVPNKMTPLTAVYTINSFQSTDPLPTHIETRGFAVRSDGSSVELFYRPDPTDSSKLIPMSVITDVAAKKTVNLVPFGKWKTTYPLSDQQINSVSKRPVADCPGERDGTILGYQVLKSSNVVSGSERLGPGFDKVYTDMWRAPALNCLTLRTETTMFKDGKIIQRESRHYTSLQEGEPDRRLFEIPQEYSERSPSEVMTESQRLYPTNRSFNCGSCDLTLIDQPYIKANSAGKRSR